MLMYFYKNGVSNKNASKNKKSSIEIDAMSKDSLIEAISDIYDKRNSIEKWDLFVEEIHNLLDGAGVGKEEDIDIGLEKIDIKMPRPISLGKVL